MQNDLRKYIRPGALILNPYLGTGATAKAGCRRGSTTNMLVLIKVAVASENEAFLNIRVFLSQTLNTHT